MNKLLSFCRSASLAASLIIATSVSVPALSAVHNDITDPRIVARMGELTLSTPVLEIFWRSYNHPSQPVSPPQAMQRIIDDALLAAYARQNLPAEFLENENKVGFLRQVQREDRSVALLRKAHEKELFAAIQSLPEKSLDGILTFNPKLTAEEYQRLFALNSSVNIEATAEQEKVARRTPVVEVDLGNKKVSLSLWDIYRRQNVQGRLSMLNADLKQLHAEARERAGSRFVLNWADNNSPAEDVAAVKQIVANEQDKTALLQSMGLYADVHDDNPVLRLRAEQVPSDQVLAFYNENKDEFAVVEKVKARHIQLATQEQADKVKHELEHGLSFDDAIARYSIADDKNAKIPGDLGWLIRKDSNRGWIHSVAFTHQKGQTSMPFRSPQGDGKVVYEILYIDEREDGYLDVTDATVHYEASRDIALKQLKDEFYTLQKTLRNNADVHLNPQAFKRRNKP